MLRPTVAPQKYTGGPIVRLPLNKAAELLKPYPTKFEIPVALEVTITSKEVLVRRPAPPGIRHFFCKRSQYRGSEAHSMDNMCEQSIGSDPERY